MGCNREQRGSRVRGIPPALVVGRLLLWSVGSLCSLCASTDLHSSTGRTYVGIRTEVDVPVRSGALSETLLLLLLSLSAACLLLLLPPSALLSGYMQVELAATRLRSNDHFLTKQIIMITYVRLLCRSTRVVSLVHICTGRSRVSSKKGRSLIRRGRACVHVCVSGITLRLPLNLVKMFVGCSGDRFFSNQYVMIFISPSSNKLATPISVSILSECWVDVCPR